MKITLEDTLSLLSKYEGERTPVLAAVVTPSLSVARVVGRIQVSNVDGDARLLVREEDSETNPQQIKPRLADCVFEYGDFRGAEQDEESAADRHEAFLVVASGRGDILSLFEPKG